MKLIKLKANEANNIMKKSSLGRGLGSLIPKKKINLLAGEGKKEISDNNPNIIIPKEVSGNILQIDIDKIEANPFQPRKKFSKDSLLDLSSSIKKHGILQPLIVSELSNDTYELIAGERRLRASKIADLNKVPVIVKKVSDFEKLHLAIIENIQRADLNPLEEAISFEKLATEFKMTHERIAKEVGKSRSFVSNSLRLLNLPEHIKDAIMEEKLNSSQSRSLVSLSKDEQEKLFNKIIGSKLTSRQVEDEARKVAVKTHTRVLKKDPNIISKEEELQRIFGTKVVIKKRGNSGQVAIDFYSEEELNSIMGKIMEN